MKTFVYLRVSTDKQSFDQQLNTINGYLSNKGITPDEVYTDEGISGSVSYKNRSLNELLKDMQPNDCLVVSEISRIGRSMSDLNKLVNDELKKRKLRLIIVSMGLDLDCSNLKAIDEMILFAFSFSAQIEKEMNQERTKAALNARKQMISEQGYFISKSGKRRTALGGNSDGMKAAKASAESRKQKALSNEHNIKFAEFIEDWEQIHGRINADTTDFDAMCTKLNKRGLKTATGLEFNPNRVKSMIKNVNNLFLCGTH